MENNTLTFNVELSVPDCFHLRDALMSDLSMYREMLSSHPDSDICKERVASLEKLVDMFLPSNSLNLQTYKSL